MPATIYFSGSITGGRGDVAVYREIVYALRSAGYRVLAGAVAAEDVGASGERIAAHDIFERDLRWLDESDLLVAEVSTPSHGVGYEVAYARYRRQIPVICLTRTRCSAMLAGDPAIELLEYAELAATIPRLLESIRRLTGYPARLP